MRRIARASLFAALILMLVVGANVGAGLLVEQAHPPIGRFIERSGVRLHYVEGGQGTPVVLLHGNGAMVEDMLSSGLMADASRRYHVFAFDRPGFGHSTRPGGQDWTPAEQARLLREALAGLGIRRAIIVGHSWGALVAATMALQEPQSVAGLVLVAGYFYPDPRPDVHMAELTSGAGVDVAANYTLIPALSWLLWPQVMDVVFGPEAVPAKFEGFPRAMALRPWQLEAATEEVAMLPDATARNAELYGTLSMPVSIVVGTADRLIDPAAHSLPLHAQIKGSSLHLVAGGGHMVHQTATSTVMEAIDEVAQAASTH
ncbi:alpha/beta hydrolase [Azorhizobium oxalatiphilum]|uniref:Alpha/beta hydrolase n=1 Tax=Azorhizobium oxalatiphilum TaxID=980631 RepID=A0A917F8M8_9HYPH|nr:alpha/beta hydrolase [Azorhizobium oxalatiphilum]GGF55768.1 alpha/beta hydrolase [Azorhizobium oxalatiphilum]